MLVGLLLAAGYGAGHALSPGHGKAMVAAYLIGSRGTACHAVVLGLTVTVTHTQGVFLLGVALLVFSETLVPERVYPALTALSGAAVFLVGLRLAMARLPRALAGLPMEDHGHSHSHTKITRTAGSIRTPTTTAVGTTSTTAPVTARRRPPRSVGRRCGSSWRSGCRGGWPPVPRRWWIFSRRWPWAASGSA